MKPFHWFLVIIAVIGMVYLWMLFDTNSVIDDVLSVMNGSVDEQGIVGKMYSGSGFLKVARWNNTISRIFVVHNFSNGIMWVNYKRQGYEKNGDYYGISGNILSKWTIHKENGKWRIIKIDEAP